jgi:hypothetical protein
MATIRIRRQPAPQPSPASPAGGELLDDMCLGCVARAKSAAVSWLMMASYGYYVCAVPILSDATYDWLARFIANNWDEIRHPHKRFMERESLASTSSLELSAYGGPNAYPNIVRASYQALVLKELKLNVRVKFVLGAGY